MEFHPHIVRPRIQRIKQLHVQFINHQQLVYLRRQGVVHQDVGPCRVGSEGPDGASGEQIPVVLGLEELSQSLPWPRDLYHLILYVLRQALLQRLRDHRDLIPAITLQHTQLSCVQIENFHTACYQLYTELLWNWMVRDVFIVKDTSRSHRLNKVG